MSSFDSDCIDSRTPDPRYDGLSEDELMAIWERRNLKHFDRRQRLLAEQRQRQQQLHQQEQQQEDDMIREESVLTSNNEVEEPQVDAPLESLAASSSVARRHQQPQPQRFICAADDPQWREITSRNIMGDYDPHRASREPAYLTAWMACQRLVNMNRSGVDPDDFIPTNPRLAALLEHRKREIARERHEEETALRQQREDFFRQREAVDQQGLDMDIDAEGDAATLPGNMLSAQAATEEKRSNQVHRLQRESQGSSNSRKRVSSGGGTGFYMALPYPTQQLFKAVVCSSCNCALYTTPVALRFFCQTCGRLSSVPRGSDEERYEEKMQDAEDQDFYISSSR